MRRQALTSRPTRAPGEEEATRGSPFLTKFLNHRSVLLEKRYDLARLYARCKSPSTVCARWLAWRSAVCCRSSRLSAEPPLGNTVSNCPWLTCGKLGRQPSSQESHIRRNEVLLLTNIVLYMLSLTSTYARVLLISIISKVFPRAVISYIHMFPLLLSYKPHQHRNLHHSKE